MQIDGGTITVALAVIVPAATAIAGYATLRERVNRLDRTAENLGERVGKLERRGDVVDNELSRGYRTSGREEGAPQLPAPPRRPGG